MTGNHYSLTLGLLLAATTIGFAQPVFITQPKSQTNVLGTTANFTVGATGTKPLSYQWMFGSPPVSLDGASNVLLVITNVQNSQ